MKRLASLTLQGLVALLPVALTLYLLFWLLRTMETMAGGVLQALLPEMLYFRGLGLLSALVVLACVGLLVHAYAVRYLLQLGDQMLSRIPLVKSVHGAIRDVLQALSLARDRGAESVVLVEVQDNVRLIGFVTARQPPLSIQAAFAPGVIGVYLPMSYQIGGYTVYLPADRVQRLDISVEEGMRIAVTGGMQTPAQT